MTQWGLDTLFNPAKRHMDEEKRRLQSTREEVGDNSGGRRVDFDSGKVTIKRTESEEADAPDRRSRRADRKSAKAPSEKAAKEATPAKPVKPAKGRTTAKDDPKSGEPTEAQIRAAKRRGRAV